MPFRATFDPQLDQHSHELADCALLEDVVPAAGHKRRYSDAGVLRLDAERGPVVVVAGPCELLVVVGGEVPMPPKRHELNERELPEPIAE